MSKTDHSLQVEFGAGPTRSPQRSAASAPFQPEALTDPRKAQQRNVSLDYLKLVLAFMIVALHAGFLGDISLFATYLTSDGIFRIAVPIFLVINGFYFFPVLQRKAASGWFGRVLGLYVFWTAVYAPFWIGPLSLSADGVVKGIRVLFVGYYHLWYLSGMIGAGALVLLLRNMRKNTVLAIAVALYLVGVAIQYSGNYHVFENATLDRFANITWVHRNFLLLSFPFFYVGYYIHASGLHQRFSVLQLSIVSLVGLTLLLLESYVNYVAPGREGAFDNYLSLLLVCPAIFMAVQGMKIYKAGLQIGLYSSGIYFVHILVMLNVRPYLDVGPTVITVVVLAVAAVVASLLIPLSRRFRFVL